MESLNKSASATFAKLIDGLVHVGDARTINNSTAFMAVHVEIIGLPDFGYRPREGSWIVSVAHYYEQNGDLVCDPDVTFMRTPEGTVFPMTFEQGGVTYQVAAKFEDHQLKFNKKAQKDLVLFCNDWMGNIAEQQNL